MSVIVYGAKNRDGLRTEDIIDLATGLIDENGNPFELIELVWNGSRNTDYAKTKGFEDTIIRRETRGISINYRRPGALMWMRNAIGVYTSRAARTPWNVRQLAATFYDNKWTIKDPIVRAEVKALADKIEAGLTDEQREFEAKRRKDLHRKAYERDDDVRMPIDPVRENEERINLSDRFDVAQRNKKLDERERRLLEREQKQQEREQRFAEQHGPTVRYQTEALQEMKLPQLRRILRDELNIDTTNRLTKADAIDMIEEAQDEMLVSAGGGNASGTPGEETPGEGTPGEGTPGKGNADEDTGIPAGIGGDESGESDDTSDDEEAGQQRAAEAVTG